LSWAHSGVEANIKTTINSPESKLALAVAEGSVGNKKTLTAPSRPVSV